MIREAMEFLFTRGQKDQISETIHVNEREEIIAIRKGNGDVEVIPYPKDRADRSHQFLSLESFIDYLSSEHCGEGVVFVGETAILADLDYGVNNTQKCNLSMEMSNEFKNLQCLFHGVRQKELWQLLIGDLSENFDGSLLQKIGTISYSRSTEEKLSIAESGIDEGSYKESVRINFQRKEGDPPDSVNIPLVWTFTGPVWDCYDQPCELKLRLELVKDDGLKFVFHPIAYNRTIQNHRKKLVAMLRENLGDTQFLVYEGMY